MLTRWRPLCVRCRSFVSSDGVTIDTVPPSPPGQGELPLDGPGPGVDLQFQAADAPVGATWGAYDDATSGVDMYLIRFGTSSGGGQVAGTKSVGLSLAATAGDATSLRHGTVVYATLCAVDRAGNVACSTSDGVVIDRTPPDASAARVSAHGTLEPVKQVVATAASQPGDERELPVVFASGEATHGQVTVYFDKFEDPDGGVVATTVSLVDAAGTVAVAASEGASPFVMSGLSLSHDTTYVGKSLMVLSPPY